MGFQVNCRFGVVKVHGADRNAQRLAAQLRRALGGIVVAEVKK